MKIFIFSLIFANTFCTLNIKAQNDYVGPITKIVEQKYHIETQAGKHKKVSDEMVKKIISESNKIAQEIPLAANGNFVYYDIIECPNQTKGEIFFNIKNWLTQTVLGQNTKITVSDEKLGKIVMNDYVKLYEATHGTINFTDYRLYIHPIIQIDVKDGKARMTCSIPYYEVEKDAKAGNGLIGLFMSKDKVWKFGNCPPYSPVTKETKKYQFYTYLGLLYARCYLDVYIDSFKTILQQGISGTGIENDNNW